VTSATLDPSEPTSASNPVGEHDAVSIAQNPVAGAVGTASNSPRSAGSDVKLGDHNEASAARESTTFGAEFIAASDRELINAAALGERDAFEAIVLRYGPEMLRYARNMLSDDGAAEDVTQDSLVAAWKGLDNFRGDATLRTWLFTLVSHKVVDYRRRRSVAPVQDSALQTMPGPPADDPVVQATNADFLAELRVALAELPVRQRASWLLREVDGMTHAEIGRILTITPSAVRGHLVRAKAALSERMAAWR
jgi:RNA polymerase sigma-70 factor (ECF subfamily)